MMTFLEFFYAYFNWAEDGGHTVHVCETKSAYNSYLVDPKQYEMVVPFKWKGSKV